MDESELLYWKATFDRLFDSPRSTSVRLRFVGGRLVAVVPHDFQTGPYARMFQRGALPTFGVPQRDTFFRWWSSVEAGWGSQDNVVSSDTRLTVEIDARAAQDEHEVFEAVNGAYRLSELWKRILTRWLVRTRNYYAYETRHRVIVAVFMRADAPASFAREVDDLAMEFKEVNQSTRRNQHTVSETTRVITIHTTYSNEQVHPRGEPFTGLAQQFARRAVHVDQTVPSLHGHPAVTTLRQHLPRGLPAVQTLQFRYFPTFIIDIRRPWVVDTLRSLFPPRSTAVAVSLWQVSIGFRNDPDITVDELFSEYDLTWLNTLSELRRVSVAAITVHANHIDNGYMREQYPHNATTAFDGNWTVFYDLRQAVNMRQAMDLDVRLEQVANFSSWEDLVMLIAQRLQ